MSFQTAALAALTAPSIALAAPAPPSSVETIIVRGRAETTGSAPVAAARLDSEVLQAIGPTAIDDLIARLPGVHMINDQDPGTNIIGLRGVTTDRLQQPAIALIRDDAPLGDTELFTLRLFDLAGVEVLKGPQGAQFGRNAAGGVIALRSRRPGDPGALRLTVGDGGLRETAFAADLRTPGNDGWGLRAAGLWRAADGWITNRTLRRVIDAEESRNLRLTAAGPVGDWRITILANWMNERGGAAWASSGNVTGRFGGRLDGAALTDPIGDFEGRARRRYGQIQVSAERPLAGGSLVLLAAHDRYHKGWVEELDYRPGPLTFFGAPAFPNGLQPIRQPTTLAITTAQARWQGDLGPATVTIGAFAQDVDRRRIDDFGPLLFGAPPPLYRSNGLQSAVYAGVQAPFDDGRGSVEAQLRYDHDARDQTVSNSLNGRRIESRSVDFQRWQPRFAVRYSLTDDLNVWASWGEAFRSGGFNPIPGPGAIWGPTFAPEVARSSEIGAKLRQPAWGGDFSLFRTTLDQWQAYTFLDGNSVTLSVDEVEIDGVDLSAWARPAPGVRFDVGFAASDARIVRFTAPDPLLPGRTRAYAGKRTPNTPEWTGFVAAQAEHRTGDWTLAASGQINATGRIWYEIDNALVSPAKSWGDVRLSASRGPWTISAWARNVTDERWAISAFGQGMLPLLAGLGPGGPFDTFTINRGRQIGLDVTRRFGEQTAQP
jgi:iron complex outermembrane recepter protein